MEKNHRRKKQFHNEARLKTKFKGDLEMLEVYFEPDLPLGWL